MKKCLCKYLLHEVCTYLFIAAVNLALAAALFFNWFCHMPAEDGGDTPESEVDVEDAKIQEVCTQASFCD